MARRAALLKCEESFSASDRVGYEEAPDSAETGFIEFKDSVEWQQAYSEIKDVLAAREHVPSKAERKAIRQQKARTRK